MCEHLTAKCKKCRRKGYLLRLDYDPPDECECRQDFCDDCEDAIARIVAAREASDDK